MPMSDVIVQHTPPAHGRPARWSVNALIRPERGVAAERSVEAHLPPPRECRWVSALRVACGNGDIHPKRFPISECPAAQTRSRRVVPTANHSQRSEEVEENDGLRSIGSSSRPARLEMGVEPGV